MAGCLAWAPTRRVPRSALAINDRGLLLVQHGAGTWLIPGSADGLVYAGGDRLAWLLALLEQSPADIGAMLPHLPAFGRHAATHPGAVRVHRPELNTGPRCRLAGWIPAGRSGTYSTCWAT